MSQEQADAVAPPGGVLRPKHTAVQNVGNFFRRKPLGAVGAVIALLVLFIAIFAPIIATDNQYKPEVERVFASPSSDAWLGGDDLGRDVFSRLVYGARISLYVGILSSFIGSSIGMLVGVASAYFGGKVDLIVQRFVDGMTAFPSLILAVAIMAALGSSINNVVIALAIIYIPSTSERSRGTGLFIRSSLAGAKGCRSA